MTNPHDRDGWVSGTRGLNRCGGLEAPNATVLPPESVSVMMMHATSDTRRGTHDMREGEYLVPRARPNRVDSAVRNRHNGADRVRVHRRQLSHEISRARIPQLRERSVGPCHRKDGVHHIIDAQIPQ
jgi:hypothetical protein